MPTELTKFTDLFVMFDDILEYVKAHGVKICGDDNVIHLLIGYATDSDEHDRRWSIKLRDMKVSLAGQAIPPEDMIKLSELMRVVMGRQKVGWALDEGYLPWTDWDRFEASTR